MSNQGFENRRRSRRGITYGRFFPGGFSILSDKVHEEKPIRERYVIRDLGKELAPIFYVARDLMRGITRKDGHAALTHVTDTALRARAMGLPEIVQGAMLLHDTLEDVPDSIDQMCALRDDLVEKVILELEKSGIYDAETRGKIAANILIRVDHLTNRYKLYSELEMDYLHRQTLKGALQKAVSRSSCKRIKDNIKKGIHPTDQVIDALMKYLEIDSSQQKKQSTIHLISESEARHIIDTLRKNAHSIDWDEVRRIRAGNSSFYAYQFFDRFNYISYIDGIFTTCENLLHEHLRVEGSLEHEEYRFTLENCTLDAEAKAEDVIENIRKISDYTKPAINKAFSKAMTFLERGYKTLIFFERNGVSTEALTTSIERVAAEMLNIAFELFDGTNRRSDSVFRILEKLLIWEKIPQIILAGRFDGDHYLKPIVTRCEEINSLYQSRSGEARVRNAIESLQQSTEYDEACKGLGEKLEELLKQQRTINSRRFEGRTELCYLH